MNKANVIHDSDEAGQDNNKEHDKEDLYLTSLFNSLQEELIDEYGTKEKEKLYHFYTRFQRQQRKIELFVRLNRNTESNKTKSHLHFIMTIDHNFPTKPPSVVFASELTYPSLYDQRNLLHCLHPEWKTTSKITTIINNMHSFIKAYLNDIENNLFVFYGTYVPYPHLYCINDFLCCNTNSITKVKVILDMSNSLLEDYYIVMTDMSLVLFSIEASDRSKVQIVFMSELRMIDGILRMTLEKDIKAFDGKIGFQLLWKDDAFPCDYGFLIDKEEFKKFQDEIMEKNIAMANRFCLYLNSENNSIETLKKVIKIKEAFLEKVYDWYTFNLLMELYQSLIELSSNKKNDQVSDYVQRLQFLLKKYNKPSASTSTSTSASQ